MYINEERIRRDEFVAVRVLEIMSENPHLEEYEARFQARSEICLNKLEGEE